jgi:hypothetical protein
MISGVTDNQIILRDFTMTDFVITDETLLEKEALLDEEDLNCFNEEEDYGDHEFMPTSKRSDDVIANLEGNPRYAHRSAGNKFHFTVMPCEVDERLHESHLSTLALKVLEGGVNYE